MIVIYFNPECSKCNTTICLLEESGKEYKKVEYLKTPPTREELEHLINMLGIEPFKLMRKSEPLYIAKFNNKKLSGEEAILAMLEYPVLMERPIVVIDGKAVICRPPEKLWDILKNNA